MSTRRGEWIAILVIAIVIALFGCKFLLPIIGASYQAITGQEYQNRKMIGIWQARVARLQNIKTQEDFAKKFPLSYVEIVWHNRKNPLRICDKETVRDIVLYFRDSHPETWRINHKTNWVKIFLQPNGPTVQFSQLDERDHLILRF